MEKENYILLAKKYFELFSNKDIERLKEMFDLNCSLQDLNGFWRWLGIQFVISEKN